MKVNKKEDKDENEKKKKNKEDDKEQNTQKNDEKKKPKSKMRDNDINNSNDILKTFIFYLLWKLYPLWLYYLKIKN